MKRHSDGGDGEAAGTCRGNDGGDGDGAAREISNDGEHQQEGHDQCRGSDEGAARASSDGGGGGAASVSSNGGDEDTPPSTWLDTMTNALMKICQNPWGRQAHGKCCTQRLQPRQ